MDDLRKAAEMALEALEMTKVVFEAEGKDYGFSRVNSAAKALRQALAESANSTTDFAESANSTTDFVEQEWDGPTDEEYENFCSLIQREEAKLKEKNAND